MYLHLGSILRLLKELIIDTDAAGRDAFANLMQSRVERIRSGSGDGAWTKLEASKWSTDSRLA
jgi:hypothetical protein